MHTKTSVQLQKHYITVFQNDMHYICRKQNRAKISFLKKCAQRILKSDFHCVIFREEKNDSLIGIFLLEINHNMPMI